MATACLSSSITDMDDTTWWSLSDGVLTLSNDDTTGGVTNVYESVIGSSVTKVVKTGPGRVRLTGVNTAFTGAIDIQAGVLAGNVLDTAAHANDVTYDNFGRPSAIDIAQDAAFEITDPNKDGLNPPSGRVAFFTCPVRVQGAGPDDAGAVRRSYPRINGASGASIHLVFNNVTMTGPTTFGCGGRWGIGTKLDMGGYKLTIVNKDKSAGQTIFEFGRSTTLTISNQADIDIESGEFLFEGVTLSPANVLKSMKLTMKGGLVRTYNFSETVPMPMIVPSGASATYNAGPNFSSQEVLLQKNRWTGTVTLDGTLALTSYSDNLLSGLNINAPINGAGTLATGPGNRGTFYIGGGNDNTFGSVDVQRGHLVIHDSTYLCVTNGHPADQWGNPTALPTHVGAELTDAKVPRLIVTNAVFTRPQVGTRRPKLGIGFRDNTRGIFEIRAGAVVTNDLHIGYGGYGAVYQSGGFFHWKAGDGNDGFIGANKYGYYGLTGGELVTDGWMNYGRMGRSVMIQRGGKMRVTQNMPLKFARAGWNSYAQYCILGGELDSAGEIRFSDNGANSGTGSEAVFAVKGANAKAKVKEIAQYAGTTDAHKVMGVVSVADGGELTVNRIYKRESTGSATSASAWTAVKDMVTNTVLYLTFDGGTLKTGTAGEFFYDADGSRAPNRVLVYEKGATIDTDGKNVTWCAPLARPEGKGLDTVTINNATLTAADYTEGPGVVKVYNNGWFDNGGTVLADFDDATRTQAAAAIVTCPGERYTEGDCTVKIENRDLTAVTITRTLRDLGSGSFTKKGAGTLTLTSTNTYAGATRLEGGTLAFTHAQGYPGGDLEIAAAAVQGALSAPLLTAHTLAFNAGRGVRVTEADTLDDKTFGAMKTVATFTTPLDALPSLTLVDGNGDVLPPNGLWCLQLADGGRTLMFGAMHGTIVIFR